MEDIRNVVCVECGEIVTDAGKGVVCEICEDAELPYWDDKGNLCGQNKWATLEAIKDEILSKEGYYLIE